jgi:putative OPT family oligopeptide transporter
LVFYAYGIAGIVPHPGIDPNSTLSAPQASAIAMLTKNIISSSQDWSLIFYGIGIGVIALILDTVLRKKYKIRCPILSVGLGIYLPPDLIFALFLGGFLRLLVSLKHKKITKTESQDKAKKLTHKTNLFVCGLVTGESLMGLFLAVPFVLKESSDALKIVGDNYTSIGQILGAITTILVIWYTYKVASKE